MAPREALGNDPPDLPDLEQESRLASALERLPGVALAFSGGVDSSYLLAVSREVRGHLGVRAFLGVSPSLADSQRTLAHRVAGLLDVRLEEVPTDEMGREGYRANRGDRCFFCKDTLFSAIRARLDDEVLLEGTNRDDVGGHRPGMQAARNLGVRSPLLEVGLGKDAIRRLSRRRGLPTADLPASPCLASRVPAGRPVTVEALRRIEAAETCMREAGFVEFRVRHHGDLARIEVPAEDIGRLSGTDLGDAVTRRLQALGYRFVTVDLRGFRSGSVSLPPTAAER